jgi:hypothetical protein
MVAWHEMPGNVTSRIRPGGYGMIDRLACLIVVGYEQSLRLGSHRPFRKDQCLLISQAFHARLPSFSPSGTRFDGVHLGIPVTLTPGSM